jgi:hypothetical protein
MLSQSCRQLFRTLACSSSSISGSSSMSSSSRLLESSSSSSSSRHFSSSGSGSDINFNIVENSMTAGEPVFEHLTVSPCTVALGAAVTLNKGVSLTDPGPLSADVAAELRLAMYRYV